MVWKGGLESKNTVVDWYLFWLNSVCRICSRRRPSRSRPRRQGAPACRTWSDLGRWWWGPRRGPRSAATAPSASSPHPSPRSPAAVLPATGSSRWSPACSASPYISETFRFTLLEIVWVIDINHKENVNLVLDNSDRYKVQALDNSHLVLLIRRVNTRDVQT